jgi:hypothetical protein
MHFARGGVARQFVYLTRTTGRSERSCVVTLNQQNVSELVQRDAITTNYHWKSVLSRLKRLELPVAG